MKFENLPNFTLFITLSFALSCSHAPKEVPVVDMDNPTGYINLKLSDLLDDITIVPMETRDDLLFATVGGLSTNAFTVTNNYILALTNERLLQFDRQGSYIRTLTFRGRGPNEFNQILSLRIDEKREIVYYNDFGIYGESVFCIDLKSGVFLEPVKPDLQYFSIREIDYEGNIYGFLSPIVRGVSATIGGSPVQEAQDSLVAYRYNAADKNTTIFKGYHALTDKVGAIMFRQGDHILFHLLSYSDTLFKIDRDKIVPQYVVKLKNQEDINTTVAKGGQSVYINFLLSGIFGTVIQKVELQVVTNENGAIMSINNRTTGYLFLDKKAELQTIRSVAIEPVALTIGMEDYIQQVNDRSGGIKINPIPYVSGSWGYYAVEGYNMVYLINQALAGNQLSAAHRKILEEVAARIDDDSNPVLIIGKVK